MKSFIVLIAVLASAKSMAMNLSPSSTWPEIFADREAVVVANFALAGITLDNACVTNNTVETIHAVPVCVQTKTVEVKEPQSPVYTEYQCVQYANQKIVAPRTYQNSYCQVPTPMGEREVNPALCTHVTETVSTPNTIHATVVVNRGEADYSFEKDFTLPACK